MRTSLSWLTILVCVGVVSSAMAGGSGPAGENLRPCPSSPNCVCSETSDRDVQPLAVSSREEWEGLVRTIVAMGGSIERMEDGYVHATFRSRVFGFVDDLECRRDGDVVQVRSASRSGWWDLGVNRRRVERLRAALAGAEDPGR